MEGAGRALWAKSESWLIWSRIAVVSMARYHPNLDRIQDVERDHAWPVSHCSAYIQKCCQTEEVMPPKKTKSKSKHKQNGWPEDPIVISSSPAHPERLTKRTTISPLEAATEAYNALPPISTSSSARTLSDLWLSRVCRTAGHELGHCFGIDHCVYYACSMQGTAGLSEDARQPPYLCPVDLAKVLRATGSDAEERYSALLSFCEGQNDNQMFSAFGAWLRGRLSEMKDPT